MDIVFGLLGLVAVIVVIVKFSRRKTPPTPQASAPAASRQAAATPSTWLSKAEADSELVRDAAGTLQVRVAPHKGQLRFASTESGKFASAGNLALARLGIFYFGVRGTSYYHSPLPGVAEEVKLVREPDNQFDKNAIALLAKSSSDKYGHVNKGFAARLAKRFDAGEPLVGIAMSEGGGTVAIMPESVAVELDLWE